MQRSTHTRSHERCADLLDAEDSSSRQKQQRCCATSGRTRIVKTRSVHRVTRHSLASRATSGRHFETMNPADADYDDAP